MGKVYLGKDGNLHTRIELNIGYADGNGEYVEVGDRWVDALIEVVAFGGEGEPRLELTIDSTSGVPRCTRLQLAATDKGPSVRQKDLRTIKLDDLLDAIVPMFVQDLERDPETGAISGGIRVADSDSDYYKRARTAMRQVQRAGRRKVTPDLLRRVADVYRSDEDRPAEAVELAFGVSERTAYRYISLAREQGLLEGREA